MHKNCKENNTVIWHRTNNILYCLNNFWDSGYGLACVIDIMCNTLSGIGAGFLTGGGGLMFQAYEIESFCEKEVIYDILFLFKIK